MNVISAILSSANESTTGLWIFLGVVAVILIVAVRAISRVGLKRLQSGERKTPEAVAEKRKSAPAPEAPGGLSRKQRKKQQEQDAIRQRRDADVVEKKAPVEEVVEPVAKAEPDLLLKPGTSLNVGLGKTRDEGFVGRLGKLFAGRTVDAALMDEIEAVLFTADIGVRTSEKLLDGLREGLSRKELSDTSAVWNYLRSEARKILTPLSDGGSLTRSGDSGEGPYVVLVIGVNGAGKTTTIGKLSDRLIAEGRSVLIGAGDTFRAAAAEQLAVWANRVDATFVQGDEGADPSSVLFDAVQKGAEANVDVVLCDTAGRLHTNVNLVEELRKIRRVIGKAQEGAPHEVLLVVDATNGQNAIQQARIFGEALDVTSVALTKLDGTAKGGVVLGISDELNLPIRWVGVGERTEDLRPFDPEEFVTALFDVQS